MNVKKIALGLLGALVALVVAVLVLGALQPDAYTVERSRVVAGTPERVAPYLTDLRQWITWNPRDELEPSSRREYSEPASGVGAWYTWEGEEVGSGRMEIMTPAGLMQTRPPAKPARAPPPNSAPPNRIDSTRMIHCLGDSV
jgi:hypothetical protein